MPVTATQEYVGVPRDAVANYNGKQLIYISWDHHLLFAAWLLLCVPPQMSFNSLIETLQPLLQADPDAASIDWQQVEWLKSNQPWTPDFERSLADNGIDHKHHLRMRTPGLNTLAGGA